MALTTPLKFGTLADPLQLNEQVDDYTLVLTDAGKKINMNKGTAVVLTIPANASVPFPIGTQILVEQKGAGQVSVVSAGPPPTVNIAGGAYKTTAQYSVLTLTKTGTDVWMMTGDKVADVAEFSTTDTGSLTFVTRGPASTGMWIDWGDGNSEWIQHIGTGSDVTTVHDYAGAPGTKTITFSGVLSLVTKFKCSDALFAGNVSELAAFEGITYLYLYGQTSLTGDVSSLSGLTGLTYALIAATGVTGDLGALNTLTSCETFHLYGSAMTGDIADLASMTQVTSLRVETTSASGNIGALKTLTSLTILRASGTSITGDIGELDTLASLTDLRVTDNSMSYGTTTLPAWGGTVYLYSDGFSTAEVDNFFIDLDAAGGTGGTLNIGGTNAAPSAAAITAINNLIGKSWDLTFTVGAELLADGDMEAVGTAAWSAGLGATLSKQGSAHGGAQCLRVLGNVSCSAYQTILTVGKIYRVAGWARGDGTAAPAVVHPGSPQLWIGTSSTIWQEFDVVFTATGTLMQFEKYSGAGATYIEFDDVSVKELV